jgi:hypothetical protein
LPIAGADPRTGSEGHASLERLLGFLDGAARRPYATKFGMPAPLDDARKDIQVELRRIDETVPLMPRE